MDPNLHAGGRNSFPPGSTPFLLLGVAWILVLCAWTPALAGRAVEVLGRSATAAGAPAAKGGLIICTNIQDNNPFAPLLASASRHLSPKSILFFHGDDFPGLRGRIQGLKPEHVVVVAPPETIDLTFHLKAMALCLAVDDDPFPDFTLAYITGANPDEGTQFLSAGARARALGSRFPRILTEAGPGIASRFDPGSPSSFCPKLKYRTLLHADPIFLNRNRNALEGVGIVSLFGDASPWGIESGIEGSFLRENQLRLFPAVVVSGETDLGTVDYYYPEGTTKKGRRMNAMECFCLAAISRKPAALMLALGPGFPAAASREIERLCLWGESLGAAQKAGFDAAVLSWGKNDARELLDVKNWEDPEKVPPLSRAFSRILFGDPRFAPYAKRLGRPPFTVKVKKDGEGFHITWLALNPGNYAGGLDPFSSEKTLDRISFRAPIHLKDAKCPGRLEMLEVKAGKRFPKISKVLAGLERWGDEAILHVLVLLDPIGGESVFSKSRVVEARFRFGE